MVRDWANLPPELLQLIAGELRDILDCIRLRCVCSHWRSSIGANDTHSRIPWLFLSDPGKNIVCFLNPSTYAIHSIHLPEARGKLLFGSLHGWLIMIDHQTDTARSVSLLNPITKTQITLPRIPKSSTGCNAILCFNPAIPQPDDLMVVIWSGTTIFLIRHGDDTWVQIKAPVLETYGRMVYFNRRVYVVENWGNLAVINVDSSRLDPLVSEKLSGDYLLVQHEEVSGNLSLIRWRRANQKIEVYKLDMSDGEMQWVSAAGDIGDYELYITYRQCISIACPRDSPTRRKHRGYYFRSFYEYKEDGEFDKRVNLDQAISVSSYRCTWMLPSLQ